MWSSCKYFCYVSLWSVLHWIKGLSLWKYWSQCFFRQCPGYFFLLSVYLSYFIMGKDSSFWFQQWNYFNVSYFSLVFGSFKLWTQLFQSHSYCGNSWWIFNLSSWDVFLTAVMKYSVFRFDNEENIHGWRSRTGWPQFSMEEVWKSNDLPRNRIQLGLLNFGAEALTLDIFLDNIAIICLRLARWCGGKLKAGQWRIRFRQRIINFLIRHGFIT